MYCDLYLPSNNHPRPLLFDTPAVPALAPGETWGWRLLVSSLVFILYVVKLKLVTISDLTVGSSLRDAVLMFTVG